MHRVAREMPIVKVYISDQAPAQDNRVLGP